VKRRILPVLLIVSVITFLTSCITTNVKDYTDRDYNGYQIAYSGPNWTLIPEQTGHPFRLKLDTDSGANWTVIPV